MTPWNGGTGGGGGGCVRLAHGHGALPLAPVGWCGLRSVCIWCVAPLFFWGLQRRLSVPPYRVSGLGAWRTERERGCLVFFSALPSSLGVTRRCTVISLFLCLAWSRHTGRLGGGTPLAALPVTPCRSARLMDRRLCGPQPHPASPARTLSPYTKRCTCPGRGGWHLKSKQCGGGGGGHCGCWRAAAGRSAV